MILVIKQKNLISKIFVLTTKNNLVN